MSTRVHASPHGERVLPEVELLPGTQVIGDLHIDLAEPAQVSSFCEWLRARSSAPRIIVLGDLFEYWVGPAQLDEAAPVLEVMRSLVDGGTALDLIPGNRDFLLERRFEERSGATLRPSGMVGVLAGASAAERRVLLIHGDELCTLDLPYQRMRRVLRSGPVRGLAFSVPGPLARWAAGRLRRASRRAIESKANASMEQQPAACLELAERTGCRTVVCGHAHRFRDELLEGGVRWLVVDAFGGERDTLEVDAGGELRLSSPECPA